MMNFPELPYANIIFLCMCLLFILYFSGFIFLRKWQIKDHIPFVIYFLVVSFWTGIYLVEIPPADKGMFSATLFVYLFFILASSMKFLMAFSLGVDRSRQSKVLLFALFVVPILTMIFHVLAILRGENEIFYFLVENENLVSGRWITFTTVYTVLILIIGVLLMFRHLAPFSTKIITSHWGLLHALLIPIVLVISRGKDLLMFNTFTVVNLYPYEILSLFFVAFGTMFRFSFNDINRGAIVENMADGWMVIDEDKKIIDLNIEGANILGLPKTVALNMPFDSFGLNLPLPYGEIDLPENAEIRKSFKKRDELRYYGVHISSLVPVPGKRWRLLLWRDATNQKLSENARQSARDEMFVLLNAVSSEASQSASLSEFLDGAIYQLIFSFRNQAAIVYLPSDIENGGPLDPKTFKPMSVFGISSDKFKVIQSTDKEFEFFNVAMKSRIEPILIDNPIGDPRLPAPLRNSGFDSVLFLPFVTRQANEPQNIGGMFLARKEKTSYATNEILRLSTLADHIANLVDNERRRKLAVAFSERQRLMRDLHDSVSQKLYGLVTLTEAAQAIIETGGDFDPQKMMSRIGENARQAVREMRLFLHQMQVVEIEKEGFISALHHRLAAVEGRADIKAGLIADETIKLLPDVEVAFYYIAQEALNNILRHARATKVIVTFKQTKKNIILRITDDGKGFKPEEVDQTGLGLTNMKDRTEMINGKFKLESVVGKGTVVTITVPKTITDL